MLTSELYGSAKVVWDYLKMNEPINKADVILVLGSHDLRVAKRGADLFNEGLAPRIIFSGGFGRLTGHFTRPEAEMFAEEAMKAGVPPDKIIIENESTNTGENIRFSYELLQKQDLDPQTFIMVTKPYMEKRAFATFKKILPNKDVVTTSPLIDFDNYPTSDLTRDEVINIMVGDLQRIKIYPDKGFQIPMNIPEDVWNAYKQLVAAGYNKHIV